MSQHRFQSKLSVVWPQKSESPAGISPRGFVMIPVAPFGWTENQRLEGQWLAQWALTEAHAVLRPSIIERDLLGEWN